MPDLLTPSPSPAQTDSCIDLELARQRVVEMIGRQADLEDVLNFLCRQMLCRQMAFEEVESQMAFFLLKSDLWSLAAQGELTPQMQSLLTRIVPEDLSLALLEVSQPCPDCGAPFANGWARHLYSGIGELLGMFVLLSPTPLVPDRFRASRIASICGLATLAIEQRNLLDELVYKADHDSLTGLYNRVCFERMLGWRLAAADANGAPDANIALLHVNLDRFRLINDVMGHSIGNRLLKQVGWRFQSCLQPGDILARVGGDEFAVLLADVDNGAQAAARADGLLDSLQELFAADEHRLFINASIGIGCRRPESTVESLQREAYVALYHAKRAGKSRSMQFDSFMAATPPERLEMEKRLRSALANDEILLHYQPQLDLSSGTLVGAEVLIRWQPQGLGIISPSAFVPILEETGMIVEFGHWVLRQACLQAKRWLNEAGSPFRLAINASALQFARREFAGEVEQVLAETGFPPRLLELELTESMFVGDYAAARVVFERLKRTGITLALDDFGTGQSSLAYLRELPFDRLKIDQSFIRPIGDNDVCPPVVENIVRMAASLGMVSTAEGIETVHQLEVLRSIRCNEGQGFLFSLPLSAAEFCRTGHRFLWPVQPAV